MKRTKILCLTLISLGAILFIISMFLAFGMGVDYAIVFGLISFGMIFCGGMLWVEGALDNIGREGKEE